MHDLMNDLATSVASEFFVRLDTKNEKNIRNEMLEKYHHMSFVCDEYVAYKNFEAFKSAKSLRTFLATHVGVVDTWQKSYLSNKILTDLLPRLSLLRVLSLSNFLIREVPEFIFTLRYLRYLNLSRTRITHLPENVCNLYNLETLIVFGCRYLAKLPNTLTKLKNIRHLDIRDTPFLHQMPSGIGELKSLQTLSKIIIGVESGFEIAKLKDFNNLSGKVSIMGLDKVKNTSDARVANFSQKILTEFEVIWSDELDGSRNEILEKEVLNELKPCNDKLTQLKIMLYGGLEFPNWVGSPSFLHLKHVSLSDCKRCTTLPSLGQLSSLKELFIEGLDGVEVVGLALFGNGGAFPSLETLTFVSMLGWKKWSTNSGVVFPCVKHLLINDCPNLVEVTLASLPSLNVLKVNSCPSLVEVMIEALPSLNVLELTECDSGVLRRLIQVASAITKLSIEDISGLSDAMWRGVIQYLGAVKELWIWNCNELSYLWESDEAASKALVKLRELRVGVCDNLVSLAEKKEGQYCKSNLLTSLRMLELHRCENLADCSVPDNIELLIVSSCTSITALPTLGKKLKSFYIHGCNKLMERELGGKNISKVLEYVHISEWANMKSIIEVNHLVHLTDLKIEDCESLESFPYNELSKLTLLKNLEIINCPSMDACFPCGVWPPNMCSLKIGKLKKPISEWGTQNFPSSLVELRLYDGEDGVSSCTQISNLLPSSLTFLDIIGGNWKHFQWDCLITSRPSRLRNVVF
ncbi:hypothetical protein QVD17_28052 [Tagetes erecta]|uniref:Uncharacterized protein n=1 Tax=Tagetes erecta TaxID=13708 RepID=A0AAD8KD39_TARER|nr:hypothetical protein QVD17_28052 [Tagetes erecta]